MCVCVEGWQGRGVGVGSSGWMPELHSSQVWQIPNTRQYMVPFWLKKKAGYGLINSARNVSFSLHLCIHVNDTFILHPRGCSWVLPLLWGGHTGREGGMEATWWALSGRNVYVCVYMRGGEDSSWGGCTLI